MGIFILFYNFNSLAEHTHFAIRPKRAYFPNFSSERFGFFEIVIFCQTKPCQYRIQLYAHLLEG
jgi:hypothetical protein